MVWVNAFVQGLGLGCVVWGGCWGFRVCQRPVEHPRSRHGQPAVFRFFLTNPRSAELLTPRRSYAPPPLRLLFEDVAPLVGQPAKENFRGIGA